MYRPIPIPELTDYYFATKNGDIVSMWNPSKPTILKPYKFTNAKGRNNPYSSLTVKLTTISGKKNYLVHRLIALAYLGQPPDGKYQVNHKDGNPLNNRPYNLEWCSGVENMKHAYKSGLKQPVKGEKSGRAKLSEKQAREIIELKGKYPQQEVANIYNVTKGTIGHIWRGHTWRHINP